MSPLKETVTNSRFFPVKFKSCQFQKECPLMCERLFYIFNFKIFIIYTYFSLFYKSQTKRHKLFYIKIHYNIFSCLIVPVSSQITAAVKNRNKFLRKGMLFFQRWRLEALFWWIFCWKFQKIFLLFYFLPRFIFFAIQSVQKRSPLSLQFVLVI